MKWSIKVIGIGVAFVFGLVLISGIGRPTFKGDAKPHAIRIFYSGDLLGNLQPCG